MGQSGVCKGSNPIVCPAGPDTCQPNVCNWLYGFCVPVVLSNGSACSDGSACTQTDKCSKGTCVGSNPLSCPAIDACHVGNLCNNNVGCINLPVQNGTPCNDNDACTQSSSCQGGTCAGSNPISCPAPDQCNVGLCSGVTGQCGSVPVANGTACDDGDGCTQSDSCQAGVCTGASPLICQNGGTCQSSGGSGACQCAAGFTGTNCQTGVNDCLAQPCQNGGTCVDGVNSYTCTCPSGFTGTNCQTAVVATCSTGFADCDGSSANGCETNLSSSAASCGACGNACGAGLLCAQGTCKAPPATPIAGVPISFPEVHGALAPAVADIDGDGILDVLVANAESGSAATPSGSLTVRRGNGDGTLKAEEYYTGAPLSSTAVVVSDVNGDGWLDAITVNGQTNLAAVNGSISVYLNAGAGAPGTFGAPTTFTTGAPGSLHLCAADFNGDGHIDIATTSVSTNKVSVMLGNGAGGFSAPQLISIQATGGSQSTVGAADLNGDGHPDLVVTSPSVGLLSVLINQGNGSLAAPVTYTNNKSAQDAGIAFGDFDGDGKLDILSNGAAGSFLVFFKGNGNGTLVNGVGTATGAAQVTNSALGVVAGDFNGDGKLDAYVLHAATNGGVYPFTGHGNGTFTLAPFIATGNSPGANALALADLDHDGYLDLVLTNKGSATITVILNAL